MVCQLLVGVTNAETGGFTVRRRRNLNSDGHTVTVQPGGERQSRNARDVEDSRGASDGITPRYLSAANVKHSTLQLRGTRNGAGHYDRINSLKRSFEVLLNK
jgi:hypothetical protein